LSKKKNWRKRGAWDRINMSKKHGPVSGDYFLNRGGGKRETTIPGKESLSGGLRRKRKDALLGKNLQQRGPIFFTRKGGSISLPEKGRAIRGGSRRGFLAGKKWEKSMEGSEGAVKSLKFTNFGGEGLSLRNSLELGKGVLSSHGGRRGAAIRSLKGNTIPEQK